MNILKTITLATAASMGLVGVASAAIVSADFRLELDVDLLEAGEGEGGVTVLGLSVPTPPSARVFESLGVTLGAGDELNISNEIANPIGWVGGVRVNLDANGALGLVRDQTEDQAFYDFARLYISNMVLSDGDTVAGLTVLEKQALWEDGLALSAIGPFIGTPPTSTSTFSDGVEILWDFRGGNPGDLFISQSSGSFFQIELDNGPAPVPLPAGLPLLLGALGGLAVLRRKS